MNKISDKFCVSISDISDYKSSSIIEKANFVELRFDLHEYSKDLIELLINQDIKILATYNKQLLDRSKIAKMKELILAGISYVDIDILNNKETKRELLTAALEYNCTTIYSYHNYYNTPELSFLQDLIEKAVSDGADLVKLACHVNFPDDALNILSLYKKYKNIIAFGMGPLGTWTRVCSLSLGAPFAYVAVSEDLKTAPGQLVWSDMEKIINLYGYRL